MARSDRLFRLMDLLRRLPAPVTAARLAQESGVSQRQLYRDIATLRAGGALIDGEAGLGYRLTEDSALPPQSFSRLEIEALSLAIQALPGLADDALNDAAQTALAKIVATLPDAQARYAQHAVIRSHPRPPNRNLAVVDIATLREACWREEAIQIDYTDLANQPSQRIVWPLALSYRPETLMLLAYCRLREDHRIFHVNRISCLTLTGEHFRPRRAALLNRYIAAQKARWGERLCAQDGPAKPKGRPVIPDGPRNAVKQDQN